MKLACIFLFLAAALGCARGPYSAHALVKPMPGSIRHGQMKKAAIHIHAKHMAGMAGLPQGDSLAFSAACIELGQYIAKAYAFGNLEDPEGESGKARREAVKKANMHRYE